MSNHINAANFKGVCKSLSRKVEAAAMDKLFQHDYIGLDPRPDAPNTLEDLKAAHYYNPSKFFPVFDGACDKTIYTGTHTNLLLRAWHDLLHIELNAPFNLVGEVAVAGVQVRTPGLNELERQILYTDIVAQTLFADAYGSFPEDQRGFVMDVVNHGLRAGLAAHAPRSIRSSSAIL